MEIVRKALLYLVTCLLITTYGYSQYTQIPDVEFENWLLHLNIDSEGLLDGQVLTDDIDHVVSLEMSPGFPNPDYVITDLTGIEDFVALENLRFANNLVTEVDLSQNTQLRSLVCRQNNLTSLNLTNNLELRILDAGNCFPETCEQENTYTNLDLSQNVNLEQLGFFNLDTLLSIDLTNNPSLFNIDFAYSSNLQSILVDNGSNLTLQFFRAIENPSLVCIQVDDPDAATAGDTFPYDQWNIQDGVIFSDDCSLGVAEYLERNTAIIPNPTRGIVEVSLPLNITMNQWIIFDVLGKKLLQGSSSQMDLSSLSGGLYTLVLQTDSGRSVKKVMKQ